MPITPADLGQLIYDLTYTNKPYGPTDSAAESLLKIWQAASEPIVENFLQADQGAGLIVSNSGVTVGVAGTLNFAGTAITSVTNTSGTVTVTINSSASGPISITTGNIADNAVTYAKIQNVSANTVLGRTGSSGSPEEITVTSAGRNLLDDADAATQRATLQLGTLATQNGTFSGTSSGTNTGDQTNISGNAATVTTNANLTGPVTSVGNATAVTNNSITNSNLRQSSGLSIIGRSANTTGDVADIAGTNGQVLRVSGTTLGFGLLSVANNINCSVISVTVTHGSQLLFANPLSGTPIGFTPLKVEGTLGIASTLINTSRTDGQIGLTIEYQPPYGAGHFRRDATQSITTATETPINFDASAYAYGAISLDASGDILLGETGIVAMSYFTSFAANATGERSAWLRTSASSNRYGSVNGLVPAGAAGGVHLSGAQEQSFVAGDLIQLRMYQTSGGNLNTEAGATRPRLSIRYVAPPVNYSATVTGILWG